ncbi:GNAT family N-acetyltransferase [uncultured Litoreibacter sp.]|uniref:GNAT family N-acetyltransferase n=1 Tax=uncultured Litoreibacter sp. TaxID=1392394 RepID=UPI00261469A6|nr:GNAT family N-acetyltransferase [uncultured Litoreibacter sp.]
MTVRAYSLDDAEATYRVFFDAVRLGAKTRYTTEQRTAWVPDERMPDSWPDKLARDTTFVSEEDGRITGFMQLLELSHVDMAYVAPDKMGTGTASDLYDKIEAEARKQGFTMMTTEASHLAKSFFAKQGWQVEAAQVVTRNGVEIPNFRMFKDL